MSYTREVEDASLAAVVSFKVIEIVEKVSSEVDYEDIGGGESASVILTYGKVRCGGEIVIPADMLEDYKCSTVADFIVQTVDEGLEFAPAAGVELLSDVPGQYRKMVASNVKVEKIEGDKYKVEFDMEGGEWEEPEPADDDSDWLAIMDGREP